MIIDTPVLVAERRQANQAKAELTGRVPSAKDTPSATEAAHRRRGTIDPAVHDTSEDTFNQVTRRTVIRPVRVDSSRSFPVPGDAR